MSSLLSAHRFCYNKWGRKEQGETVTHTLYTLEKQPTCLKMLPLSIMQISSYMIGKCGGMTSVKCKNLWFKSNSAKAKELKGGSGMIIFSLGKVKAPSALFFLKIKVKCLQGIEVVDTQVLTIQVLQHFSISEIFFIVQ